MRKFSFALVFVVLLVRGGISQDPSRSIDENQVLTAVKSLGQAFDRLDADSVDSLVAEKFILVTPTAGVMDSRKEIIAALRQRRESEQPVAKAREWIDLMVRVTDSTAIATGTVAYKDKRDKPTVNPQVTQVWIKQNGGWRALSEQRAVPRAAVEGEVWNYVFSVGAGTIFNAKPNSLLVQSIQGLKPGKALDVGMGEGRNAIYLAKQGWDVTGMDPAEVGLAIARRSALEADVRLTPVLQTAEEFDWGENKWDLIAVIYMNPRGFEDRIRKSLKTGGLLVVEGFHSDAAKDRPIGAGVVFQTDELKNLLPEFEVVRYQEPVATADYGLDEVRLVQFVARKR